MTLPTPAKDRMPFKDHRTVAEFCIDCGTTLSDRNKTGRCRLCSCRATGRAQAKPKRHCHCGKQLGHTNTSGLCAKHFLDNLNADPDVRERRVEGIRKDSRERIVQKRAVLRANARKALERPEYREHLADRLRKLQPLTQTPEALARRDNVARGRAISEARMGWCPLRYREEYLRLVRSKRIPAAEAKVIIRQAVLEDRRRAERAERKERSERTFEETLRLVAEGKLTVSEAPKAQRAEPLFTMGGVASGWGQ